MNTSPILGRILWAVLYGFLVFIAVLIIGIIFQQLTPVAEIGTVLKKFAPLLGLLAGLVAFFTGAKPLV